MAKAQPKTAAQASKTTSEASEPAASTALAPLAAGGLAAFDPEFQRELAASAKAEAATERPQTSKLSIRGGILAYEGNNMPDNQMDVVVVSAAYINTFYIDRFNADNPRPPKCFAVGLAEPNEKGVLVQPHMEAHAVTTGNRPENTGEEGNCATCAMGQWKSDPNGGKGKACKEKRRIVVIPRDAINSAEDVAKAEMASLDIPVMSVANWATYINKLAASTNLPFYAVVTKLGVVPDPRSQYRVTFDGVGAIPSKDVIRAIQARRDEANVLATAPFEPWTEQQEAPQSSGKKKY